MKLFFVFETLFFDEFFLFFLFSVAEENIIFTNERKLKRVQKKRSNKILLQFELEFEKFENEKNDEHENNKNNFFKHNFNNTRIFDNNFFEQIRSFLFYVFDHILSYPFFFGDESLQIVVFFELRSEPLD